MSQPEFTFDVRIGLLFTVEAATLSICAVTIILCYALWARTWRKNEHSNSEASDSILFLNLMFADLIQGIGTMPNIKWMNDGYITEGELCTAQAALKQVGIVGVAMTSLAVALYTFIVLVLRKDKTIPRWTAKVIVVAIWIFVAIVIGSPNVAYRNEKYYGATVYWCWILHAHEAEQIVTEYLWVWFAALSMLLLYPIMFLLMRGWIGYKKVEGTDQIELNTLEQPAGQPTIAEDPQHIEAERTKRVAQKMLYYPLIYIVCTLPNSAARWMMFKGHTPSTKFTLAANTLFALSGFFNFILFFITRPSWVVGDRRRGENRQQSGSQAGRHGRPPPENPEPAVSRRQESDTIRLRGVYSSPLVHSPTPNMPRSLPDRPASSTPGHGDGDYGFLPPGRS